MIVNDTWLKNHPEIFTPFVDHQVREENGHKVISYGVSSAGYDIRLSPEFKMYSAQVLDPKRILKDIPWNSDEPFELMGNDFILARSLEWIAIPSNCVGTCYGKSTYARVGLLVNVTPLEPGWKGFLTIELSNTTPYPIMLYPNEGIAQIVLNMIEPPEVSYDKRNGKYMNQTGVVLPII